MGMQPGANGMGPGQMGGQHPGGGMAMQAHMGGQSMAGGMPNAQALSHMNSQQQLAHQQQQFAASKLAQYRTDLIRVKNIAQCRY